MIINIGNKKNYLLFVYAILLITISANAQKPHENPKYGPDSLSRMVCLGNLSTMSEYVKIEAYDYAYDAWRYCFFNCPESSKNVYLHGEKILENKIKKDEANKEAYIDTLMLLYDQRIQYFKQEGKVLGKKGLDLFMYRPSAAMEAYGYLSKSIDLDGVKSSDAVLANYMVISGVLYNKNEIEGDEMVTNYVKASDLLSKRLDSETNQRKKDKITQAIESVEKVFSESGAADCETLVEIFNPKFEENKDNLDFLKKTAAILGRTPDCDESELFAKVSEAKYAIEPSAGAAADMGKLFAAKGDYDKASEYFVKAISQETDNELKAQYNYDLARVYYNNGSYTQTRKYAKDAIAIKSSYGEAYILIGKAYGASSKSCGSSPFEQAAVYWAAVDKFAKAKSVDSSVASEASNLISQYSKYFPGTEDAFFAGYSDGQDYTVGCWINESTKVRTVKH